MRKLDRALVVAIMAQLFLAATSLAPKEAGAEQCEESAAAQARLHKQRGQDLISRDPEAAAAEFQAAYQRCRDPWYLGMLTICFERAGQILNAIASIDAFLASGTAEQRDEAVAARARLQSLISTVEVTTSPSGASLIIDGNSQEPPIVTPRSVQLDPGNHTIEVQLDGHAPQRQEFNTEPGQTYRLDLTMDTRTSQTSSAAHRRVAFTGSVALEGGGVLPIASPELQPYLGIGGNVSAGIELSLVRVEMIADIYISPESEGYLMVVGGGPRVGVRLGRLPLFIETSIIVAMSYMKAEATNLHIGQGSYINLSIVPSVSLAWGILDWLDLLVTPARLELLALVGDPPFGLSIRWGINIGVRFRM